MRKGLAYLESRPAAIDEVRKIIANEIDEAEGRIKCDHEKWREFVRSHHVSAQALDTSQDHGLMNVASTCRARYKYMMKMESQEQEQEKQAAGGEPVEQTALWDVSVELDHMYWESLLLIYGHDDEEEASRSFESFPWNSDTFLESMFTNTTRGYVTSAIWDKTYGEVRGFKGWKFSIVQGNEDGKLIIRAC